MTRSDCRFPSIPNPYASWTGLAHLGLRPTSYLLAELVVPHPPGRLLQTAEWIEVKFHVAMHGRTQALVKVLDEPVGSRRIEKLGDGDAVFQHRSRRCPHTAPGSEAKQGFDARWARKPDAHFHMNVRLMSQALQPVKDRFRIESKLRHDLRRVAALHQCLMFCPQRIP